MLDQFIADLPAEKQEAYKAAIAHAVIVSSREDAARALDGNQFLKSERDALVSRTTDNYARKFQEEKLPGLIEEEYKKRNPPKDAKDQALAEMQAKLAKMERDALLKDRKAAAMQKLTEAGLPADLADFAIHEDENIFGSNIERLVGLKAWQEAELKKALTGAVGNQKPPQGGKPGSVDFAKMTHTEINTYAMQGEAEKAAVMSYLKTKR